MRINRHNPIGIAAMAGVLLGACLAAAPGAALAQGGGGRPGGGFGGPGGGFFGGPLGLVMMPEVQKELKLEDGQVELLKAIRPGGGKPFDPQEFQKMTQEERMKRFAAMQAETEKQISDVLEPKQMQRLKQLQLQQSGLRALNQKDVADSLKLTPDQRDKVKTAMQGEQDGFRKMFEAMRPADGAEPPSDDQRRQMFQQMQTKMTELRSGTETKLKAVLTDAQSKQFTQMQGAPFKFPAPRFGPGGPGRPGGPPPTN